MWQMIQEEIKTGKTHCCGEYTSRKQGLQYAPDILDWHFDELGVDIDEKDNLIGDFMQCGGKMAVEVKGYQFYLSKRMHDVYGKKVAEPSGTIRVNGTAKWKDPDGGKVILVVVDEIASPEVVKCHYLNGKGEVECPWEELSAA